MRYNLEYRHVTLGPGFTLPPNWHKDAAMREKVHAKFDEVVMRGDIPVNLSVVGLVTNAYLYTRERKYRDWIVEYVEAWMERIEQNGGIIPDNVGLTGKIGEYRDGQWWGGHYGWAGLYSLHMIGSALIVAAQCAQLVTRDARYLNLLRSQLDMLLERAISRDGKLLVPFKHTDEGWTDYRPLMTIYSGALLQGRVRYFDPACKRPGLPRDVAALVNRLEADRVSLELVNLSICEPREVLIQAGCYGEHEFTVAEYSLEREGKAEKVQVPVNDKALVVRLRPGTEMQLDIGMRRYVHQSSYAFPWHVEGVPVR